MTLLVWICVENFQKWVLQELDDANHKDGKKYGKDGKILPQEKDWATSEKAMAAKIHKEYRDRVTKDAKYIRMRKMWRDYEAGLTI